MKKLIKQWRFDGDEARSTIELGAGARLSPSLRAVTLVAGSLDATFRTILATPQACRGWLLFQTEASVPEGAALRYRLADGAQEWYWSGATWSLATLSTHWSTEKQLAENLPTFAWQLRSLGIVCRMTGTASAAPVVKAFKALYNSNVEHQEDVIWRSLRRQLAAALRPIADSVVTTTANQTTISLASQESYDVDEAIGVYDHELDPDRLESLMASYNASSKLVTLTEAQDAGRTLIVEFKYKPLVVVTTDRLFGELARVPAVSIESLTESEAKEIHWDDEVIDSYSGNGWRVKSPRMVDIQGSFAFMSGKAKDQTRLGEEIKEYFANNFAIRAVGVDEWFRISVSTEEVDNGPSGQAQLYSGRIRFKIHNVTYFHRPAEPITRVSRFIVNGSGISLVLGEPPPAPIENAILLSGDGLGFYIAFSGDQEGYEQLSGDQSS